MNKENAKHQIKGLVDKYNKVVEEKRVSKYNEEMTKKDFILPLFRALGWDVENSSEVTAEETISKKRVDYGFRINGIPKFFLEAKALKEDLNNPKFIGQAIDYAWAKSCTWAVLSDFENVMIFNAEWKTDNLLHNLLRNISCQEFLERFDELWLLSRESFEQGLIDKEAERLGKKAKLAPIDQYLLDDFARLRNALSKNILRYNTDKKLTEEELDETVQKLLNRLVFIRKAEDAELEERVLEPALREWESGGGKALYVRLGEIFKKFNEIYDSELFEETLVDQVVITNDVLKEVITGLYKPADKLRRYDFSIIDADVLGNVYEQYLGHILKKTKKRADVKESHARRKEQGIYYTPTYIVDYIVRNTLGELLKDKKVDVEKIKVLDPACGSGSFLIKAFDVFNEHYGKHDKDYAQTQLDITGQGTTFTRKVKILQDNIFGVDLDKQAVEIARLNLLLKIAEKGQRLPLLRQNIKNGNSLIDDEKIAGDKAFIWGEKFKPTMDAGGFDVVIGNPPWLMAGYYAKDEMDFLRDRYRSASGKFDMYYCFIEKSIELLAQNGLFGMIVPNKFFHTRSAFKLRELLAKNGWVHQIIDFGYERVFSEATNYSCILIIQKGKKHDKIQYAKVDAKLNITDSYPTDYGLLRQKTWHFETPKKGTLFKKIESKGAPLEEMVARFGTGAQTGADKILILDEKTASAIGLEKKLLVPILKGRDVRRYHLSKNNKLIFPYKISQGEHEIIEEDEIKKSPKIYSILEKNKNKLANRLWFGKNATQLSGKWYGLMYLDRYNSFNQPHILTPSLSNKSNFTLGEGDLFVTGTAGVTSIILELKWQGEILYVLGILNSKLAGYYILGHSPVFQGGYHKFSSNYLKGAPIKKIDWSKKEEKKQHDEIVELVKKMLSLSKRLNEIGDKKTDERQKIEEEIREIDIEIDELVYKLYGINEEEKKIIEESLK
jgi:type I restriction-modification system DNA methylase subunit